MSDDSVTNGEVNAPEANADRDNDASVFLLSLPERFGIAQVDEAYQQIKEALGEGKSVSVAGESVEAIDAAGLQLLVAAKQASAAKGVAFSWAGTSDAFKEAVAILNLEQELATGEV